MPDLAFPPGLINLQKRSHAAWAAVQEHRRQVDARRVADADAADAALRQAGGRVPEIPTWGRRALPPWTAADDQEHERLVGEVTEAALALRAAVAETRLDGGYDVTQGLHAAARA